MMKMAKGIMFEVVPPTRMASRNFFDKTVDALVESINRIKSIGVVNIPEIIEENFEGKPFYRNFDNRELGKILRERCNKEIMINKVVVHFDPKEKFNEWLEETINKFSINKFVFVGGTFPLQYPGPSVLEANEAASKRKVAFGNITIPPRPNESDALIKKTKAGCSFFTSQVLFEAENTIRLVREYSEKCRQQNLKPAAFYLSLTPISRKEDLGFLEWLGAYFDPGTLARLNKSNDIAQESLDIANEVFQKIASQCRESGIPYNLNIEYITLHNLELTGKLAEILGFS